MWDHKTGRSKGYGFVSFRDHQVLLILYAGIYWRDQPMNHPERKKNIFFKNHYRCFQFLFPVGLDVEVQE